MLNSKCFLLLSAFFGNLFASSFGINATPPHLQNSEDSTTSYTGSTEENMFLGKPCNSNLDCPPTDLLTYCNKTSSDGKSGVCACLYGELDHYGQCPGVPLGKPCKHSADCVSRTENSRCDLTHSNNMTGVCTCLYGDPDPGGHCQEGVPVGKPCNSTPGCLAWTPYSHCNWTSSNGTNTTGVCSCLYGQANHFGQCPGVPPGKPCNSTSECLTGSGGKHTRCNSSHSDKTTRLCVCLYGDDVNGNCPGRQFGQPCTSNKQCNKLNSNSFCSLTGFPNATGTCACLNDMDDSGICTFPFIIKLPPFIPEIDFPPPHFDFGPSSSYATGSSSSSYSSHLSIRGIISGAVFVVALIVGVVGTVIRRRMILAQGNAASRQNAVSAVRNATAGRQNYLQANRRVLAARPNALTVGQNPRAAVQRDPVPTQAPVQQSGVRAQQVDTPPSYDDVLKQDSELPKVGDRQPEPTGSAPGSAQ